MFKMHSGISSLSWPQPNVRGKGERFTAPGRRHTMQDGRRKIGIMISAAPKAAEFESGISAAERAAHAGAQVYLYCIDSAVEGMSDPRFARLKESGVHLFACAYSLQRRGLVSPCGATLSGLTVLSDIMASTDEFQSFN